MSRLAEVGKMSSGDAEPQQFALPEAKEMIAQGYRDIHYVGRSVSQLAEHRSGVALRDPQTAAPTNTDWDRFSKACPVQRSRSNKQASTSGAVLDYGRHLDDLLVHQTDITTSSAQDGAIPAWPRRHLPVDGRRSRGAGLASARSTSMRAVPHNYSRTSQ